MHVHQQAIRQGEDALIVRTYRGSTHHRTVEFTGPCRLVQNAEPDRCGARVWIEADYGDLILDGTSTREMAGA